MNFTLKEILEEKSKTQESILFIEKLKSKLSCEKEIKIIGKSIDFQKKWYTKLCKMEKEYLQ